MDCLEPHHANFLTTQTSSNFPRSTTLGSSNGDSCESQFVPWNSSNVYPKRSTENTNRKLYGLAIPDEVALKGTAAPCKYNLDRTDDCRVNMPGVPKRIFKIYLTKSWAC